MKVKLSGNKLTIEAELSDAHQSRSGRSVIIATTRGQQYIGDFNGRPTYLQVNVMQMDTGAAGSGGIELVSDDKPTKRAA